MSAEGAHYRNGRGCYYVGEYFRGPVMICDSGVCITCG